MMNSLDLSEVLGPSRDINNISAEFSLFESMENSPEDRLYRIQVESQALLNLAMLHERAGKWNKVVECYGKMLHLLAVSNLPKNISIPQQYNMLVYESFYHLGVALQNLGRHEESVLAYKKALRAMNIKKNGCLAGCNANSCFQTPVLARKAFAGAKCGDMKLAFRDIEKAVVLDSKNPDVYCVRALLWNTNKDTTKAVEDLNLALKYNPCHVCALILKGTIDIPFQLSFNFLQGIVKSKNDLKKDHIKAKQFVPEAELYFDVADIDSPKITFFWNRFLWSLTIPRTVLHINLLGGLPSSKLSIYQTLNRAVISVKVPQITVNNVNSTTEEELQVKENKSPSKAFKCGTATTPRPRTATERRASYSNALRTYSARLREQPDVEGNIRREHRRPSTARSAVTTISFKDTSSVKSSILRPPTATSKTSRKGSVTFAEPLFLKPAFEMRKGSVSCPPLTSSGSISPIPPPTPRRTSIASTVTSQKSHRSNRRSPTQKKHEDAASYATEVHGIKIYQTPNINEAPRMYYKPWRGDKLPVADVERRTYDQISFKV